MIDAAGNNAVNSSTNDASASPIDGGGELQDCRIALDVKQVCHADGTRTRDASEIVPHHVDDHDVLGALFFRLAQPACLLEILLEPQSASGRALHRPRLDRRAVPVKEQLRRGAAQNPVARIDIRAERRPLRGGKPEEQRERIRSSTGCGDDT